MCSILFACIGEPIPFISSFGNLNQFILLRMKKTGWVMDVLLWMARQ